MRPLTQSQIKARLDKLSARKRRNSKENAAIEKETLALAERACPFKPGQTIITPTGEKFKICYISPNRGGFGSAKFELPGYSLQVKKIKRDGTPRMESMWLRVPEGTKVFDPATAPPKPRPISPTKLALDAALALIPKYKAKAIRTEFNV